MASVSISALISALDSFQDMRFAPAVSDERLRTIRAAPYAELPDRIPAPRSVMLDGPF